MTKTTQNLNQAISIECKDGRWMVNNKAYPEMDMMERDFFHRFLNEVRIQRNVSFDQPRTVELKAPKLVRMVDINDPNFDKPISNLEKRYA